MGAPTNTRWVAVVPVKALATAKSRLAAGSPEHRQALAGAFAADTISAERSVSNVELVLVICGDRPLAQTFVAPGVTVLDEPEPGGLNAAATAGINWATSRHPAAGVVVIPADLPALRADDVDAALLLAARHPRAALADREGVGTTMLTGLPGSPPRPRFGADSYAAHLADGAVGLDDSGLDRAVRDVDTSHHLSQVRLLGVGAATGRVLDAG